MEVSTEKLQAAKDCFAYHTNHNEVYVTSDLTCFFMRNLAVMHARTLADSTIEVFKRTENEPVEDAVEAESASEEADIDTTSGTKKNKGNKGGKTPAEPTGEVKGEAEATTQAKAETTQTEATGEVNVPPASEAGNGVIDRLNEIVNEAEHLLGLDTQQG